jgi:hypothetical protein
MQLYWRPGTAAFAADAALGEIDVPYERILVERDSSGNVPAEYLRINPMGQVPTLVDESLVLPEVAPSCSTSPIAIPRHAWRRWRGRPSIDGWCSSPIRSSRR